MEILSKAGIILQQVAKGVDHLIRDNFIPRHPPPVCAEHQCTPNNFHVFSRPLWLSQEKYRKKSVWDKIINSGMDGLVSLRIQVDKDESIGKVGPTRALFWRCSIYIYQIFIDFFIRFPRCLDNSSRNNQSKLVRIYFWVARDRPWQTHDTPCRILFSS